MKGSRGSSWRRKHAADDPHLQQPQANFHGLWKQSRRRALRVGNRRDTEYGRRLDFFMPNHQLQCILCLQQSCQYFLSLCDIPLSPAGLTVVRRGTVSTGDDPTCAAVAIC